MPIKSDFGVIKKKINKITFWVYFFKKIDKIAFLTKKYQFFVKNCKKGQKMTIFLPKNDKKAKKWRKRYFWQAKSAVERPFGHLSFGNFVKMAFFRIILIDFVKKRVLGIFGPQGWWLCIFVGLGTKGPGPNNNKTALRQA